MAPTASPHPEPPPYVIVGTGRSASGYLARLLRVCGIACGHETYWRADGHPSAGGLTCDSSWIAAPDVLRGDTYGGTILHQTRHPLAVVSSMVAHPDHTLWFAERERVLGQLSDDPIMQAMEITAGWLDICDDERVAMRWPVEHMSVTKLRAICARLDHPVTASVAAHAFLTVGQAHNAHGTTGRLDWWDLPDCRAKGRLLYHAEMGGYG